MLVVACYLLLSQVKSGQAAAGFRAVSFLQTPNAPHHPVRGVFHPCGRLILLHAKAVRRVTQNFLPKTPVSALSVLHREQHREGIAVRRGRYGDAGAVIGGDVLHDGKPQPRAARRLAAALVDAVEPFKDTLGVFRRNGTGRFSAWYCCLP